jgi:predicted small secreted protein
MIRRRFIFLIMACASTTLAGCSTYQLRGKVVEGPASEIRIVEADDPQLQRPAVSGVRIEATLDPQSLARKTLSPVTTNEAGEFALPIDELGAGMLEYEVQVLARRPGYKHAAEFVQVPGASKRLLIVLAPGVDRYVAPEDPLLDSRRFLPAKE